MIDLAFTHLSFVDERGDILHEQIVDGFLDWERDELIERGDDRFVVDATIGHSLACDGACGQEKCGAARTIVTFVTLARCQRDVRSSDVVAT